MRTGDNRSECEWKLQKAINDQILSSNKVINGDERQKKKGTIEFGLDSRDTRRTMHGNEPKQCKMTLQSDSQFRTRSTPY